MSAEPFSLRLIPSTKGKLATGLIGCIVIAMRHPFCTLDERLHHSGYPRDDRGLQPACAKNPSTRPLPLEPGPYRQSPDRLKRRPGSVSNVEMATPIALICKALFPSISTFETLPIFSRRSAMENTPRLYDTLVQVLGQQTTWGDLRRLKTLPWMWVGFIHAGFISLSAWPPYVVSRWCFK